MNKKNKRQKVSLREEDINKCIIKNIAINQSMNAKNTIVYKKFNKYDKMFII